MIAADARSRAGRRPVAPGKRAGLSCDGRGRGTARPRDPGDGGGPQGDRDQDGPGHPLRGGLRGRRAPLSPGRQRGMRRRSRQGVEEHQHHAPGTIVRPFGPERHGGSVGRAGQRFQRPGARVSECIRSSCRGRGDRSPHARPLAAGHPPGSPVPLHPGKFPRRAAPCRAPTGANGHRVSAAARGRWQADRLRRPGRQTRKRQGIAGSRSPAAGSALRARRG